MKIRCLSIVLQDFLSNRDFCIRCTTQTSQLWWKLGTSMEQLTKGPINWASQILKSWKVNLWWVQQSESVGRFRQTIVRFRELLSFEIRQKRGLFFLFVRQLGIRYFRYSLLNVGLERHRLVPPLFSSSTKGTSRGETRMGACLPKDSCKKRNGPYQTRW